MKSHSRIAAHKIDVILRDGSKATHFTGSGKIIVPVGENDLVVIHTASQSVSRYMRLGDDLLIYLEDGSVIECKNYFIADKNVLAFETAQGEFEHISFEASSASMNGEPVQLAVEKTPLASLYPLMEPASSSMDSTWLWSGLGLLAGGATGVALGGGGGGGGNGGSDNNGNSDNDRVRHIAINPVEHGGVINEALSHQNLALSGTSDFPAGTPLIVTVNTIQYPCTVQADGSWSVTVPNADVSALAEGVYIVSVDAVSAQDAGTVIAEAQTTLRVDTHAPAIQINSITADNIINSTEHNQPLIVSGSAIGAVPGDRIFVTIGNHTYPTLVDGQGLWQIGVPADDMRALADGAIPISATIIDDAGNTQTATHAFLIDTTPPYITINPVATDDIVDTVEKQQPLTITGTCEPGVVVVTVLIAGKPFAATVNGATWSLTLSASQTSQLPMGETGMTVTATDSTGNSAVISHSIYVTNSATPVITIAPVTTDDRLNAADMAHAQTISGSVSNAAPGDTVSVLLNGKTYTTRVTADLTWEITLSATDLAECDDGPLVIDAQVVDAYGNTGTGSRTITVDTLAPTIDIMSITADDIVNIDEHGVTQIINGHATGVSEGTKVILTVNDQQYVAWTKADGTWEAVINANDIEALPESAGLSITATVSDAAGNIGTAQSTFAVDLTPPTLTVDAIAGDDVVNIAEKGAALRITGASDLYGGNVTITLNGETYQCAVDAGGNWALTLPENVVEKLPEGQNTAVVTAQDASGNSTVVPHTFTVDTRLPVIVINTFATDNIVDETEIGKAQLLSGSVTGAKAGDIVTIHVGTHYYTATVGLDLAWSVKISSADLKALGDGAHSITVEVTNSHGNTGISSHDISIQAGLPGIYFMSVTGDDVVNAIELQSSVVVAGTCSGLDLGTTLTVKINGNTYTAVVEAGNVWSVEVPQDDVAQWSGTEDIIVTATNASNDTVTGQHQFTVDDSSVAIVIDKIAVDNVINATEKRLPLVITGKTTGVEANQLVDIDINGKTYHVAVGADGKWSLTVSALDMVSLENGIIIVNASTVNRGGEACSSSRAVLVALDIPTVQIITMAGGDGIINIAESAQPLIIGGVTSVTAGCRVDVIVNGKTYSTTASADGTWTVTLPAADVAGLPVKDTTVTAHAYDRYGNKGTSDSTLTFDLLAPTVNIDWVAGDDVINAVEHNANLLISGGSQDYAAGDIIRLTIGAKTYTTTVDADGKWTIGVPASVVNALPEGENTLTVTIADKAGNSSSTGKVITVITTLPTLTINRVSGDDIINAAEAGQAVEISGTSSAADGSAILVALADKTYNATVTGGAWRVMVPAADLSTLPNGDITISASVKDPYQNSNSATHTATIDKNIPVITFDDFAGDNIINASEAQRDQTLSGHAQNVTPGDILTLHIGSKTYTVTIKSDLSWSLSVPAADIQALGDGVKTFTADVQTASGNRGIASLDITVDADLPSLTIGVISGDDVINALEHSAAVVIQGTCGNVPAGSIVTVMINDVAHDAAVKADGTWQIGFNADEVSQWPAGTLEVEACVSNTAGSATTVVKPITVTLDGPAITLNAVAQDNYINAAEKSAALILDGATTGVEAGCTVVVKFGGKNFTARVDADGSWKINVSAADMAALADGATTVEVSVINKAGNTAASSQNVIIDSKAPLITIDPIAVDNIINQAESVAAVTLSGASDVGEGKTVSIELNGKTYRATTDARGKWSVVVPKEDVGALREGNQAIKASVSDEAGNTASTIATVTVDTQLPVLAFEEVLIGDDIINAAEHEHAQVIAGTSTGLAEGAMVTVTLTGPNGYGKTFITSVDDSGDWAIGLDAKTIRGLANGDYTVTASASDAAGNPATPATHVISVDTTPPVITITSTSAGSDDTLNKREKQTPLNVTGETDLDDGSIITVMFNGKTYHTEVAEGKWSLDIPVSDLTALADGAYTLNVLAKDDSGNISGASKNLMVDTVTPIVVINNVTDDNIVNSSEADAAQVISGKVINGAAGDAITVTLNGKTYATTVNADLTWAVSVPDDDLKALNNGKNSITVTVTDNHGNVSENYTHDFGVAIKSPVITVDTLSGDGVVNKLEHAQSLVMTGSAQNLASGDIITLVVTVGDTSKTYYGTVQNDGKSWSAVIPQADVALWENGDAVSVTATGKDAYGNTSAPATAQAQVNLNQVAVTVDPVTSDNIINAAEAASPDGLVITGSTYNAVDGDTLIITFAGKTYTTTLSNPENHEYGYWSFTVPQADLVGLIPGNGNTIAVELESRGGNSASDEHLVTYDPTPPTVLINPVTGDNVIVATELTQPLTITGSASQDAAGHDIKVTFNDKTYTATVKSDGSWAVSVPVADLSDLSNGYYTVKAEVADDAGNTGSNDPLTTVNVRITPPQIFIDPVAGDNYINAPEHNSSLVVSGRTLDAETGDEITVTFNGANYKTTVLADGTWTLTISAAVVKGLPDGDVLIDASVDDGHGNIGHATQAKATVDTTKPLLTINTLAVDNIINDDEKADESGLIINGTASITDAGRTVTVTITGTGFSETYTTTPGPDGKWSLTVPHGDIANIANGEYAVSARMTDIAGNEGVASRTVKVDDSKPVITIDLFTGDAFVNKAEHNKPQIISGTTDAPAGKTVTVILGEGSAFEKTYTTTVTSEGKWSVAVPGADLEVFTDGDYLISAKVDNSIGNHGSAEQAIAMDVIAPTLAFADNVAGNDNVVNIQEQANGIHVGGTTSAEEGQTVTVRFNNGNSYSALVSSDGSWAVDIPASEFTELSDGEYNLTAVVSDKAGNKSDVATRTIEVSDRTAMLEIAPFTGDNRVNAAERDAMQTLSGTSDADDGSIVTLTLNGKTYTATVMNGEWSTDVSVDDLADGKYEISATLTNSIGNVTTISETIIVDTVAPTQRVDITGITDDRGISATDFITSDTSLVINGTLSAALGVNEGVQISLDNGATWTAVTVNGTQWSYTDPRTLEEGTCHYQVRVIDKAGNVGSEAAQDVIIDLTAPTTTIAITRIDTDTGIDNSDFITNDTTLVIHGTTGKPLGPDEYAQISLDGGVTWQALTVDGTDWSYDCGEKTASFDCQVRITDTAGNVGNSDTQTITVDTTPPENITLAIVSISDDTGIAGDFKTKDTTLTIYGSLSRELTSDEILQISLDGGTSWIRLESDGTAWRYADNRTLTDGAYSYSARVIDLAGNVSSATGQDVTVVIDTQLSGVTPTIVSITEDTGANDSDFITKDTSLTINGILSGKLGANEWAEISIDGGSTWTQVILSDDTHWTYRDPRTLTDGDYTYLVRVTDDVGNLSDAVSQTVTIDTTSPNVTATITNFTDNAGASQDNYSSGATSDDATPTLNGTLNRALIAGEQVAILRDGVLMGYATVDSTGKAWSWSDDLSELAPATCHYKAMVVDEAGNSGPASAADFTIVYKPIPGVVALVTNMTTTDLTPLICGTLDTTNGDFLTTFYLEVKVNNKTYTSKDGTVVVDIANNTWYLQIPDTNAFGISTYTVTTAVKTINGDLSGSSKSGTVTEQAVAKVTLPGSYYGYSIAYTVNSDGSWTLVDANIYNFTDPTKIPTSTSMPSYYSNQSVLADFNRDGKTDMFYSGNNNLTGLYLADDISSTSPTGTSFSNKTFDGQLLIFDFNGDGYLDGLASTAAGGWFNNKNGTLEMTTMPVPSAKAEPGTTVTSIEFGAYASAVDLNNDGKVDIAAHTSNGNAFAYSALINQGDGTFTWGQNIDNFFHVSATSETREGGMYWADFNNDGYMDLFIQSDSGTDKTVNKIYFNNGDGTLNTAGISLPGANTYQTAYITDWNHDGKMDIVKSTSANTIQILLNEGDGTRFSASTYTLATSASQKGLVLIDYDWDGDQDILVHDWSSNKAALTYNTNSVAKGTALHIRILDEEGFNVFYGNTVNLYDSTGKRVATQVINPQNGTLYSGSDTSGIVTFYGLDPSQTYSVELLYQENGISKKMNASASAAWGNLHPGEANECHILNVEGNNGSAGATTSGTGYNDIFVAQSGNNVYDGGGGTLLSSGTATWQTQGGLDVIDFTLSGVGVTVDLTKTSAQNTGFNTVTLKNIEGVFGTQQVDTLTGSASDNIFEGRGGNDIIDISQGGHDTLLYRIINQAADDGGVGHDVVTGFKVGVFESTPGASRIDVHTLLQGSYTGSGSAHYINNVATLDSSAGDIAKFVNVVQNGNNTDIQIDRDGSGSAHNFTTIATLNNVHADLATLLANHQLIVV